MGLEIPLSFPIEDEVALCRHPSRRPAAAVFSQQRRKRTNGKEGVLVEKEVEEEDSGHPHSSIHHGSQLGLPSIRNLNGPIAAECERVREGDS